MAKKKKADARVESFRGEVDAKKQHAVDAAIKELRGELAVKVRDYNEMLTAFEDYKAANDYIVQMEGRFQEPKPIVPEKRSGESESLAIACAADWHAFETILPEQANHLNEYNPTIARASIESFFKTVVRWCEIHRAGTRIDTLVVAFLGDLISGMLWDDQMEMNAGTPLEESLFVAERVISGLDYLMEHSGCKRIIVDACDGNHSRLTDKKRKANRTKHSLEWLLFHFIRNHYEQQGEKRIEFNIADGYHLYHDTEFGGQRTIRLHHGDEGIRYQGGVGGLAVPAQRAIKQWNVGRKADIDIFGHWHTSEYPRTYICVGSLMGYGPVSITYRVEYEKPQQAFVLIEKKRWISAYHKIYVR